MLVIGDLHVPAVHPRYIDFCRDLRDAYDCNRVVFIGDVVDHHNVSFHPREIDAVSVQEEFDEVLDGVAQWHEEFPKATVTIGNHDERIHRRAASVGIPSRALLTYNALWKTPGWRWQEDETIDDVHYFHGTGHSGERPAFLAARASMVSTVIGHCHSVSGFQWAAGPNGRIFGMDVGCGVDIHHIAMRYGYRLSRKPVLAAGVVTDGQPMHFAMPCGPREKYRRKS